MTQPRQTSQIQAEEDPKQTPKKPYHKPVARYERVFEVQALTCGKVQSTQGACHFNRKSS